MSLASYPEYRANQRRRSRTRRRAGRTKPLRRDAGLHVVRWPLSLVATDPGWRAGRGPVVSKLTSFTRRASPSHVSIGERRPTGWTPSCSSELSSARRRWRHFTRTRRILRYSARIRRARRLPLRDSEQSHGHSGSCHTRRGGGRRLTRASQGELRCGVALFSRTRKTSPGVAVYLQISVRVRSDLVLRELRKPAVRF